jgi:hypothetical protein
MKAPFRRAAKQNDLFWRFIFFFYGHRSKNENETKKLQEARVQPSMGKCLQPRRHAQRLPKNIYKKIVKTINGGIADHSWPMSSPTP